MHQELSKEDFIDKLSKLSRFNKLVLTVNNKLCTTVRYGVDRYVVLENIRGRVLYHGKTREDCMIWAYDNELIKDFSSLINQ